MGIMSATDVLPPSPPTTSHRNRVPLSFLAKPATSTPDDSPASINPSSEGNGSRKRVEFSPWTNVLEAPVSDISSETSALKAIPRSKDCQTVAKSILKPQADHEISINSDASEVVSDATLDSLVEALGNNDKTTSVDAYQCLAQLIKTFEEVPDDLHTRNNVLSIVRYVRRDLAVQEHGLTTPVDINLVTQALKVTVILVWSEQFSPLLPDDFKVFITDRAVNILAEHNAPKVVIVHYMHVLATQSFRSALFSSGNRTVKLLEALRDVTNHVQGKGAMTERLLIYQKLIEQAKPIMKVKAGLWIKEVLSGLCSNVKDIRDKAISVCTKAVAAFPASLPVSQAAREALGEESKDRTLNATLTQRLDRMIAAKDEAIQVPQIWSLVMLLCNSDDVRIDNWAHIRDWLRVIQRCFNCSDINVRVQAFPAWNRFIYIIKPHEATEAMMAMLAKPIAVQIERTGANASSKGSRPAAISSYCMLLYYAFRPAATHKQYTKAWNEYIVKVATSQFLSKSTANADLCCRVLIALFWKDGSASRIWNESRAHDNKAMNPEEMPSIDCKWIRSKAAAILDMFRLLFKYSAWGPSIQHSDQAFVAKAWRAFLRAVRESSSKEIKSSSETRKALLGIVNFVNEVRRTEQEDNSHRDFSLLRSQLACRIAISELGAMSLLESLELLEGWQYPEIVLSEIVAHAMDSLDVTGTSLGKPSPAQNTTQSRSTLPTTLQRALRLLNSQIEKHYQLTESITSALPALLELCARTLQTAPQQYKLACLRSLERSLSKVLKDELQLYASQPTSLTLDIAWDRLTVAVIDSVAQIAPAQFKALDVLLASLLTSNNEPGINRLLRLWNAASWTEQEGHYGSLLTAALEELQKKTTINLPGLATSVQCEPDQSQVDHVKFMVEAAPETHDSEENNAKALEEVTQKAPLHPAKPVPCQNKPCKQVETTGPDGQSTSRPRKHDDSQLEFMPIGSSPTNPDEVDSQMLTDRQKEVRTRQRSEQGVTFADLRSSPGAAANRTSRATSIDCEMARKIAAFDNLPTTPTLAKHANTADDEEMPSPTPKARHLAFRIEDIEIPSSPPSVIATRNTDVASKGTKASHGHDVHLYASTAEDNEQLNEESIDLGVVPGPDKSQRTRTLRSSSKANADSLKKDIVVSDVVMQDGGDNQLHAPVDPSLSEQAITVEVPAVTEIENPDNDEDAIDPSASQLTQNLDWHVEVQTKGNSEQTPESTAAQRHSRKRKRTVVDYAEISGQQTRKRHSTGKKETRTDDKNDLEDAKQQLATVTSPAGQTELPTSETQSNDLESQGTSGSSGSQPNRVRPRRSKRGSSSAKKIDQNMSTETEVQQDAAPSSAFHTPDTTRAVHNEVAKADEEEIRNDNSRLPIVSDGRIDIMKALQTALDGLEHSETAQNIDLKALDDLCFKIRFKAQEIVQKKDQS